MKFNFALLLLIFGIALADTTPLPRAVPGFIKRSYVNNIRSALIGTVAPRNSIGNAGDTAGNIGNGTYRWTLFRGQSIVLINDPGEFPITLRPALSGQTVDLHLQTLTTLPLGASILTVTPAGHLGYGAPEAGNYGVSALASGNFVTSNTFCDTVHPTTGACTVFSTPIDGAAIPNLSVSLNTFGHPVKVSLISGTAAFNNPGAHYSGSVNMDSAGVGGILFEINGVPLGNPIVGGGVHAGAWNFPCSQFSHTYRLPAGNYTFSAHAAKNVAADPSLNVTDCKLEAHEIF